MTIFEQTNRTTNVFTYKKVWYEHYQKIVSVPNELTIDGISIVAENPMNSPIMLDSTRTAVLRQMYAMNCVANTMNEYQLRYTYGYTNGKNPAGTNPAKYVTKPLTMTWRQCQSTCINTYYITRSI